MNVLISFEFAPVGGDTTYIRFYNTACTYNCPVIEINSYSGNCLVCALRSTSSICRLACIRRADRERRIRRPKRRFLKNEKHIQPMIVILFRHWVWVHMRQLNRSLWPIHQNWTSYERVNTCLSGNCVGYTHW